MTVDQLTTLAALCALGCLFLATFALVEYALARTARQLPERVEHDLTTHSFMPILVAHDPHCRRCQVYDQETADGLEQAERYANGDVA